MIQDVSLLIGFTLFAFIVGIYLLRVSRRTAMQEALRRRLGAAQDAETATSLLRSDEEVQGIEKLIAESGLPWTMTTFIRWVAIAAAGGFALGWIVNGVLLGLVFGAAFAVIVPQYIKIQRSKRLSLCDAQMPQALEIMALALRAGHPLPGALGVAAAEAPSPIAGELRRTAEEHDLGRPMADVLVGLSRRLPGCEAVHTFVVAVLVLQQTGGNLIQVIERIVDNSRSRAQYMAKLRALTAEGRSSAKMMAALPGVFVLLASIMDPTYVRTMLYDKSGNILLGVVLVLWILGIFWTSKLVKTES